MSQYTIIYKYGKCTCQLKFKKELKNFPSRNNDGRRKSLRTGVGWKAELIDTQHQGAQRKPKAKESMLWK